MDEFQDINAAQYEAVKLLCGGKRNLFVVGDDDQAIYGFRGSDPAIMRQFLKDFPEAKQIFLSVNYRSRAGIVETAGKLIGQNRERFPKQIVAGQNTSDAGQDVCFVPEATQGVRRMQGEKSTLPIPTGTASGISTAAFGTSWLRLSTDRSVLVCGFQDRRQEAETVADEIGKTFRQGKSCAAIFRTNADAVWLATALKCRKIPFLWKEKPKNPYETPVCQDLLAYLQFAMEGRKRKDFLRIMNRPCRYLSRQMLPDAEISFSALRRAYAQKPYMQEILHRLEADISRLAKMDLYAAVHYIRRGMGYDAWLKENAGQTPSAGESRQGQERAPAGARAHAAGKLERDLEAADFFQEQAREFQSLTELEEAMTAYEDQMDQNMADAADTAAHTAASGTTGAAFTTLPIAELVTMHGSKGLEYDAVFLPCCMEGVVPHKKSKNQAALEEERRMFYVGMTRAKKELDSTGFLKLQLSADEIELAPEDLLIEMTRSENYYSVEDGGVTVAIETVLTDELIEEGFVREIISKLQTMRKEADFQVMDHIVVYVKGNEKIAGIVQKNLPVIENDTLADIVKLEEMDGYVKEWDINGETVILGVKRVNS